MNQSEIDIMFETGVGVKVTEARGTLNVQVALPPSYNETLNNPHRYRFSSSILANPDLTSFRYEEDRNRDFNQELAVSGPERCTRYTRTLGLLGTYNHRLQVGVGMEESGRRKSVAG